MQYAVHICKRHDRAAAEYMVIRVVLVVVLL